ncbi:MAG TPA: IS3 family transposase [Myxococcota bacterium]|nr:IS3 family transposase [Myxococcota bacterium]
MKVPTHTYGSPRIHADLVAAGHKTGRRKVAKLMARNGVVGCPKRRQRNTTDSNHNEPPAPNLLNRNFKPDAPNKVWVTDITYVRTARGWTYLSVIQDLFNHGIVGWSYADHMRTELVLESLYMAMRRRNPAKGLILHSDRGSQYASREFRKELNAFGIEQSMSRKGDCWDNACAESIFSTIKRELVYQNHWASQDAARPDLYEYIEVFYNRKRRHSSNGYLSPVDYERLVLSKAAVAA